MPQSSTEVDLERAGNVVTINGHVIFDRTGHFDYVVQMETIPEGFRPTGDNRVVSSSSNDLVLLIDADGSVRMAGDIASTYGGVQGAWVTNDLMPF